MAAKPRIPAWTAERDQMLLHALISHNLAKCPADSDAQNIANCVFPDFSVSGKVIANRFSNIKARKKGVMGGTCGNFKVNGNTDDAAAVVAPIGSPVIAPARLTSSGRTKRRGATANEDVGASRKKRIKREESQSDNEIQVGGNDLSSDVLQKIDSDVPTTPEQARRTFSRPSPKLNYGLLNSSGGDDDDGDGYHATLDEISNDDVAK